MCRSVNPLGISELFHFSNGMLQLLLLCNELPQDVVASNNHSILLIIL